MRKIKNITVAVPIDLYRQTRRLAAEYDTTVTAMVAYLIERLPYHLKNARYPPGGLAHRRVLGPKQLARQPAAAPPKSWTPPPTPPVQSQANPAREPVSKPTTPADSAASRAIFDGITAAVRQYDAATAANSTT
ncbi:MAG: hypothetical protein WBE76_31965 [Terracidiphilus sp.]